MPSRRDGIECGAVRGDKAPDGRVRILKLKSRVGSGIRPGEADGIDSKRLKTSENEYLCNDGMIFRAWITGFSSLSSRYFSG